MGKRCNGVVLHVYNHDHAYMHVIDKIHACVDATFPSGFANTCASTLAITPCVFLRAHAAVDLLCAESRLSTRSSPWADAFHPDTHPVHMHDPYDALCMTQLCCSDARRRRCAHRVSRGTQQAPTRVCRGLLIVGVYGLFGSVDDVDVAAGPTKLGQIDCADNQSLIALLVA
jgi:hypothetical protein